MYQLKESVRRRGCTQFCGSKCEYAGLHHPLLIALSQCSTKVGFSKFKAVLLSHTESRSWKRDDPILDPEPEFRYPIVHWAAVLGNSKVLKLCINQGFNLKKTSGKRGETALHRLMVCGCAAWGRNLSFAVGKFDKIVHLLRPLLDCRDDNQDLPLHVACKVLVEQRLGKSYEVYLGMVKVLVRRTFEYDSNLLNSRNMDGNTPLHILAASNTGKEIVRLLVEDYAADCTLKNHDNQTPMDVAMSSEAFSVTQLFTHDGRNSDGGLEGSGNKSDSTDIEWAERPNVDPDVISIDSSDDETWDDDETCDDDNRNGEFTNLCAIKTEPLDSSGLESGLSHNFDHHDGDISSTVKEQPDVNSNVFPQDFSQFGARLKRKMCGYDIKEPVVKIPKDTPCLAHAVTLSPTIHLTPSPRSRYDASVNHNPMYRIETVDYSGRKHDCFSVNDRDKNDMTWEKSISSLFDLKKPPLPEENKMEVPNKRTGSAVDLSDDVGRSGQRIENIVSMLCRRKASSEEGEAGSQTGTTCTSGGLPSGVHNRDTGVNNSKVPVTCQQTHSQTSVTSSVTLPTTAPVENGVTNGVAIPLQCSGVTHNTPKPPHVDAPNGLSGYPDNVNMDGKTPDSFSRNNGVEFLDPTLVTTVKIEKDEGVNQGMQSMLQSLQNVVPHEEFMELLGKSKEKTNKLVERLKSEHEDAVRSERVQHQEYKSLRQRIKEKQEHVKRELEKIAEWEKQAEICRKGRELATRKKISCQQQLREQQAKLPKIQKFLNIFGEKSSS